MIKYNIKYKYKTDIGKTDNEKKEIVNRKILNIILFDENNDLKSEE